MFYCISYEMYLTYLTCIHIDLSKSLNTTPVNNYYYETNSSDNPLTTYNYFEIPAVTIIVVPAILIPLNDFPFMT